jgi:hypothetical protein
MNDDGWDAVRHRVQERVRGSGLDRVWGLIRCSDSTRVGNQVWDQTWRPVSARVWGQVRLHVWWRLQDLLREPPHER